MPQIPDPLAHRRPEFPIEPLIVRRWSPRAMSGEGISQEELMTLFEAARWAPSTYNEQEWRFLYATRDSEHWTSFLSLLVDANRVWCERAAALVAALSHKTFVRSGKPNAVHAFDAGASVQNLALQGTAMGLVVHPMAGFDSGRARVELGIPDDFDVHVMIAVGRPGDPADLPPPLGKGEIPSSRRPVREFVAAGPFNFA